ncbi:MAG: hypothetical protein GQ540_05955 [Lutibacter sp.]|uniref:hypothetical protein n=1 Tax=Lutibacter sp. TaxID=1925666 RepID=UPI0019DEB989|nr:hypothetical protein [Lutibacter sp.]NOR28054.1 hypothetical protein [Lutibacter sp.]
MKKIYFDDITNFRKTWILKSIFLIGIICILVGFFYNPINEIETVWIKRIKQIGYLFFAFYFINKIIRKNYVQWNKVGMTVRINSYLQEKRVTFNEVYSYELINDYLRIFQSNKTVDLDLSNVLDSDKERLIEIIKDNTVANNG